MLNVDVNTYIELCACLEMIAIAFLANKLTLRGTEVTMYDYADYNETYLGNKSIIITRPHDYVKIHSPMDVTEKAYEKFINRFDVHYYINPQEVYDIVDKLSVDVLVIEKAGCPSDGLVFKFKRAKTIIRCVFTSTRPHGDLHAVQSDFVNKIQRTNCPCLPMIVQVHETNENLRKELNIPESATVFGCHGGADTFNIGYIRKVLVDLVTSGKRPDIYFIFLNINQFVNHKNVIFLPGTYDMEYKRKFINTCDAMYYARDGGETFGLACGEFALCGKPTIGRLGERCNNHETFLSKNLIGHNNYEECMNILLNFNKSFEFDQSVNEYNKYKMKPVMDNFQLHLDSLMKTT